MVSEIYINETMIPITYYHEEVNEGLMSITVHFNVSHEDYHAITTLLYEGTFEVRVPDKGLSFRGTIHQYSTSITNLYMKGQIGQFHLTLQEQKATKEGLSS